MVPVTGSPSSTRTSTRTSVSRLCRVSRFYLPSHTTLRMCPFQLGNRDARDSPSPSASFSLATSISIIKYYQVETKIIGRNKFVKRKIDIKVRLSRTRDEEFSFLFDSLLCK